MDSDTITIGHLCKVDPLQAHRGRCSEDPEAGEWSATLAEARVVNRWV
jgi:hypothetical protein